MASGTNIFPYDDSGISVGGLGQSPDPTKNPAAPEREDPFPDIGEDHQHGIASSPDDKLHLQRGR
jgi:hypothetical protein